MRLCNDQKDARSIPCLALNSCGCNQHPCPSLRSSWNSFVAVAILSRHWPRNACLLDSNNEIFSASLFLTNNSVKDGSCLWTLHCIQAQCFFKLNLLLSFARSCFLLLTRGILCGLERRELTLFVRRICFWLAPAKFVSQIVSQQGRIVSQQGWSDGGWMSDVTRESLNA